jgi:hypothetical protein
MTRHIVPPLFRPPGGRPGRGRALRLAFAIARDGVARAQALAVHAAVTR